MEDAERVLNFTSYVLDLQAWTWQNFLTKIRIQWSKMYQKIGFRNTIVSWVLILLPRNKFINNKDNAMGDSEKIVKNIFTCSINEKKIGILGLQIN